jgi:hypothetical protein
MKTRLTAFPLFIAISLLTLTSCERDAEQKKTTDYQKKAIPLTGAQETPATPTTALGNMDVFYSKETRVLTYNVTWSGLTGPVTAMHIHGLAPSGFPAGVVQNINTSSGGLATPNATLYGITGKFSGNFFVDGVAVREEDLLNGMYYINIHTATYPGGEIRGQIVFQ